MRTGHRLEGRAFVAATTALLVVFVLDIVLPDLGVEGLYMIPVLAVCAFVRARLVGLLAAVSTALLLGHSLLTTESVDLNYWLRVAATAAVGALAILLSVLSERRSRDLVDALALLQATEDASLDPHMVLDAVRDASGAVVDMRYREANATATRYFGLGVEELRGTTVRERFPGDPAGVMVGWCAHVLDTGEPLVLDDVTMQSVVVQGARRFDVRGVRIGDSVSLTWRDVTDRWRTARALTESEERYRLVTANISDVVLRADRGSISWVSASLEGVLGWLPVQWVGHDPAEFVHPDDLPELVAALEALAPGGTLRRRARVVDAGGDHRWVELRARLFVDDAGVSDGILAVLHDVDADVRAELALQHRARHDELTGLANRAEVLGRLGDVLARLPRTGHLVAVAFCDLDDFKAVNDTYGHGAGDDALREVASRIRGMVRSSDVVARFGGDEIVVMLDGVQDLAEASRLAERFRSAAHEPIATTSGALRVTLSVGVTVTGGEEPTEAVVARADAAMYQAKRTGKNRVVALPVPAGEIRSA